MANLAGSGLVTTPLQFGLGTYAAQPHSQPFTYRSGATYQSLLESMRSWMIDDLVPFLEENTGQNQWDENAVILLARVVDALNTQAGNVNNTLNDAVDAVINATILVTDPIMYGVMQSTINHAFRDDLNYRYNLTDEKILYYLNVTDSGNPDAQVKARLNQMFGLTSQKIYDQVNTTGNSPFRNWLDERYAQATNAYWTPNIGGDGGARIGDNAVSSGNWQVNDGIIDAHAQIVFGSTAIWGGAVLTGVNAGGGIDGRYVFGDGMYYPYNNGKIRDVRFVPLTNSEMRILVNVDSSGWVSMGNSGLSNPTQQSTLSIHVHGPNVPA